jgi:NAD(P)-dependent dehydrogenase (short-subunit alcohol dehydrogenase family)
VVGGYGGIGEVTTELLAEYGAAVAIAGRSLEKAEALAEQLEGKGFRSLAARVDLADRESAQGVVEEVVERLGGLDILVNLAGIDLEAKAEEFTEEDWRKVIDINLSSLRPNGAGTRSPSTGSPRVLCLPSSSSTRWPTNGSRR